MEIIKRFLKITCDLLYLLVILPEISKQKTEPATKHHHYLISSCSTIMSTKKKRAKAAKLAKKKRNAAIAAAKKSSSTSTTNNNLQSRAAPAANSMGADADLVTQAYTEFSASLARAHKEAPEPLDILRMKYSLMGKTDWVMKE